MSKAALAAKKLLLELLVYVRQESGIMTRHAWDSKIGKNCIH